MVRRGSPLVVVALAIGCSWTLPSPVLRGDARASDAGADGSLAADVVAPLDVLATLDMPTVDEVPTVLDGRVDASPMDASRDVSPVDVGDDRAAPVDLGGVDAPIDRGVVVDLPAVVDVGVDAGVVSCTPGERRSCYPGPPASRGRGYCRDGVESCDASGRWSGACVNAFVPDCADRRCGSDDCGGTCGPGCAAGQVCDDLGRCVVPSCGAANFTETCADGSICPSNSNCTVDNLCACRPGYVGRTCDGVDCGTSCAYPNWYCAPSSFCGMGALSCAGGYTCPRHATCSAGGQCVCAFGYMAVTCSGDRCTSCPGTGYHCVPVS